MNERMHILAQWMLFSLIVALSPPALAEENEGAFLRDYSKLAPAPDNPFEELYIAPDAMKRAAQYTAVMIDQPEIFVHPDSKYQGIKPDDMKAIADSLREAVANELKSGYQVVDQPATNVLYVRLAIGDVMLQKKKRPILAYTPIGAVVHAGKNMAKEVTEKIDLNDFKIEGEVLDSGSLEQLGAMTASRGSLTAETDKPVSWERLHDLFATVGKRLRCRLDNSKVSEEQWTHCGKIGLSSSADLQSAAR
ncbi:MAG TPA: DUF3313 domain-containing protein [Steroidobacter sp.]|uniref:DUF3313 domain-containing protein n=1 Tax=Steroidobacter sp. TaxID=1978227 RepID=UPI002ED8DBBE